MKVDVYYPVIKSPGDNLELRYSLRSLKNIDYDNVIIIGHKPKWCKNVIHIPYQDIPKLDKGRFVGNINIREKSKIAFNHSEADDIIEMNDDIYIVKPTEVGHYIRKENLKQLYGVLRKGGRPPYVLRLAKEAAKIYPNGFSQYLHIPHRYNRQMALYLIERFGDLCSFGVHYVNEYIKEHQWEIMTDFKVYNNPNKIKQIGDRKYFSTGDDVVKHPDFVKEMDLLFSEKSNYET